MLEKTELPSREKPSPFMPVQMLDAGVVHLSPGPWKPYLAVPSAKGKVFESHWLQSAVCVVVLGNVGGRMCCTSFSHFGTYACSNGVCCYL